MNADSVVHILAFVALVGSLLMGGLLAVFQLPGTWCIVLATAGYAWYYDFQEVTWVPLAIMAGIAALAEAAEMFASMRGAAKAGASRGASWGALLGGFGGMLVFTPLIPIPILGSILGGVLGCFIGAYAMECRVHGDGQKGAEVARGAVVGRLIGLLIKLGAAMVLAGIAVANGVLLLARHFGWELWS